MNLWSRINYALAVIFNRRLIWIPVAIRGKRRGYRLLAANSNVTYPLYTLAEAYELENES